jgi:6-phosphogluconolactonase
VTITCRKEYRVSGSVSGLSGILNLQINNGNLLQVGNGSFTFPQYLATGTAYSVTVPTQPTSPAQVCTVTNGTGTVGSANITNVAVKCLNVGRYVYVVNSTDNTNGSVSAFTINATTGALTAIAGGNVAAHTKPTGIVIDSHQAVPLIYVDNATSADITEFEFATVSGAGLTPGAPIFLDNTDVVNETPAAIAIAPSGAFLFTAGYGIGSKGAIYGFALDKNGDPPLDLPAASVASDAPALGAAVDPTSTLLFTTASSANLLDVYSVASDATATAVANGPYATGNDPRGVVVWPGSTATAGFVYTANRADNTISAFAYNGTSGSLQPATTYSTGHAPVGIAIDPTGTYLYTANSADGTVSAFSINQSTGALTALGTAVASGNLTPTVNANPGPIDVKVDPSGQFVYCANTTDGSVSVFTVSAGALTLSKTYATGSGATAVAIY